MKQKAVVTQVATALLYLYNRVPKQTELRREAGEVRKSPNLVRFSASTTLVFNVLSHLRFLFNQKF